MLRTILAKLSQITGKPFARVSPSPYVCPEIRPTPGTYLPVPRSPAPQPIPLPNNPSSHQASSGFNPQSRSLAQVPLERACKHQVVTPSTLRSYTALISIARDPEKTFCKHSSMCIYAYWPRQSCCSRLGTAVAYDADGPPKAPC